MDLDASVCTVTAGDATASLVLTGEGALRSSAFSYMFVFSLRCLASNCDNDDSNAGKANATATAAADATSHIKAGTYAIADVQVPRVLVFCGQLFVRCVNCRVCCLLFVVVR